MDTFHSCCRSVYFYPRPPRGGRLHHSTGQNNWYSNFYPRPPRGGRLELHYFFTHHRKFLSTPSARRATDLKDKGTQSNKISIHALREEGDLGNKQTPRRKHVNFYPRPPRGGRLSRFLRTRQCACISIHALREEGDPSCTGTERR